MKYEQIQIKQKDKYTLLFGVNYWQKLKKYKTDNGRYMIKFLEYREKYFYSGFSKHYFIHFDSGFCWGRGKKGHDIFYTDDFNKLLPFAKFCAVYMDNHLTSIVDRKTGLEYYIIFDKRTDYYLSRALLQK